MIFLVARREVTERLRQRSFQYSLLATIVLVVAIAWLAGVLGGDDTETYRVGAQGPEAVAIAQAARTAAPQLDAEIEVERFGSAAQARAVGVKWRRAEGAPAMESVRSPPLSGKVPRL